MDNQGLEHTFKNCTQTSPLIYKGSRRDLRLSCVKCNDLFQICVGSFFRSSSENDEVTQRRHIAKSLSLMKNFEQTFDVDFLQLKFTMLPIASPICDVLSSTEEAFTSLISRKQDYWLLWILVQHWVDPWNPILDFWMNESSKFYLRTFGVRYDSSSRSLKQRVFVTARFFELFQRQRWKRWIQFMEIGNTLFQGSFSNLSKLIFEYSGCRNWISINQVIELENEIDRLEGHLDVPTQVQSIPIKKNKKKKSFWSFLDRRSDWVM